MAGSSATLHEPAERIGEERVDRHRAIVSLMEELEAVDWYDQRAAAAGDPELKRILEHNRDEEKEHAAMALEWLRRQDPKWDAELRDNLFTEGPIAAHADEPGEEGAADEPNHGTGAAPGAGSLGIGSLKGSI